MSFTRRPYEMIDRRLGRWMDVDGGWFVVVEGRLGGTGPWVATHLMPLDPGLSRGEAMVARDEIYHELEIGSYSRSNRLRPGMPTLREWADEHEDRKRDEWAKRSLDKWHWVRRQWAELDSVPINALSLRAHLQPWWSRLTRRVQPQQSNGIRRALSAIIERAVDAGLAQANPVRLLDPVRETRRRLILPPIEALDALFAAFARSDATGFHHGPWRSHACYMGLEPMFQLQLMCCLRPGEVIALRWSDVDTREGSLQVRAEIAKSRYERLIPLSDDALAMLELHRRRMREFGTAVQREGLSDRNSPIWPTTKGRLRATVDIRDPWKRCLAEVDDPRLRGFTPHKLRYMGISRMKRLGVREEVINQIAGHSSHAIHAHYSRPFSDEMSAIRELVSPTRGMAESTSRSSERRASPWDEAGTEDGQDRRAAKKPD